MTYAFYMIIVFVLVTVRTTVFPMFPALSSFYDPLLPLVLYLGFFRPLRESVPVLIFTGLIMDGISGGPFGFYLTCYAWLYMAVLSLKNLVLVRNVLLLGAVMVVAILIENGMLILVENLFVPRLSHASGVIKTVPGQVLFGFFTGPIVVLAVAGLLKAWQRRLVGMVHKGSELPF